MGWDPYDASGRFLSGKRSCGNGARSGWRFVVVATTRVRGIVIRLFERLGRRDTQHLFVGADGYLHYILLLEKRVSEALL
jgi:hypothetical protein